LSDLISTHLRAALRELEALPSLIAQEDEGELAEALAAVGAAYLRLGGDVAHVARKRMKEANPDTFPYERIMERLHRVLRHLDAVRKLVPEDEQQPLTEARWTVVRLRSRYQIIYQRGRQPRLAVK